MQHVMTFDLPEDKYDLDCALNGEATRRCLEELGRWLRGRLDADLTPAEAEVFAAVHREFWRYLEAYEINGFIEC